LSQLEIGQMALCQLVGKLEDKFLTTLAQLAYEIQLSNRLTIRY